MKEHFKLKESRPVGLRAGRSFIILPAGLEDGGPAGERQIFLYPGRAFGNGRHETTVSCMAFFEQADFRGRHVLDLGAGTGILSIAAARLGAPEVTAVEISYEAARACKSNILLNGLQERIHVLCGGLNALGNVQYHIIAANIHGDILVSLAEGIVERLKENGLLVLSGILFQDLFDVKNRYKKLGCRLQDSIFSDDYITLKFVKDRLRKACA